MSAIRVLVVDDQRVVRDGLVTVLGLLAGFEVVGEAGDGEEALMIVAEREVDVVLMDLRMPRLDGAQATARLATTHPRVKVLVLTTYADDEALFPALRAGARGYLTKDAGAAAIAAAIHDVHEGRMHLDAVVQARLVEAVMSPRASPLTPDHGDGAAADLPDGLTPREAEVLALIADGLSNAEIAARLVVSGATVKTHVNRVFMKTGARDRAQAMRYAYTHGLAAPPAP
jgi:DNA-binding NarL/FixJ family response regulator